MLSAELTVTGSEVSLEIWPPFLVESTPFYTVVIHTPGDGGLTIRASRDTIFRIRDLINTCLNKEDRQKLKLDRIADLERQIAELKKS